VTAALAALVLLAAPTGAAQPPRERRVRLPRDSVLAGVSCAPTGRAYAAVHDNGRLLECPLRRDTTIAGQPLPAWSWPRFDRAGVLTHAWLSRDTELDGVPCKGAGYKRWSVAFHPSGRLKGCFPARPVTIQGHRCRAAAFGTELSGSTMIVLDPAGRFVRCRERRG
jgi:hypothetical protein